MRFHRSLIAAILFLFVGTSFLGAIEKRIVSRDDRVYEAFPDVTLTPSGTLVVVYRECMGHGPFPFSRLVVRRSLDGGMNWSDRKILLETVVSAELVERAQPWLPEDSLAGYQETLGRIQEPWKKRASVNGSQIITLTDGSLMLVADVRTWDNKGDAKWVNKMWRSSDDGATWTTPVDLPLHGEGIVPQLTQLRDGRILLSLNIGPGRMDKGAVTFSSDQGKTWTPFVILPRDEGSWEIDETGFVELDDGTLVGFGRNKALEKQHRPSAGIKVISTDGGQTWEGPFETWLMGLEGRPSVGLLASGEVCVTYRLDSPNEMLGMHVMTQAAALLKTTAGVIPRQPPAMRSPGRTTPSRSSFWRMKPSLSFHAFSSNQSTLSAVVR